MNQQGKFCFLYFFVCNNCQKEFRQTTAYSPPAANLGETYCANCANLKYFNLGFAQSNNPSLFSNPAHLTNQNFNLSTNSSQPFGQLNFKSEKTNNLPNNQTNKQIPEKVVQKPMPKPQTSESTSKDKRFTGRTKQLNLKVKEKTYWKLKELASKNKCLMTEVLEKVLEGYEKFCKTRNKSYER